MKRKVGNLEVLLTESILVEANQPVEIFLGKENDFKSTFNFITDPSKPAYSNDSYLIDEQTIVFNLYNFIQNQAGNGGSQYPMKVGMFVNKAIYLSILVNNFDFGVQPLFTYTYYLGEEQN